MNIMPEDYIKLPKMDRTSTTVLSNVNSKTIASEILKENIVEETDIVELPSKTLEKEIYLIEGKASLKARFVGFWKEEVKRFNLHFFFMSIQLAVFGFFQFLNKKENIFTFNPYALLIMGAIILGSFIVFALKWYPYLSQVDIMIEMTPFLFAYYSYSLISGLTKNVIYPNVHVRFPYEADMYLFGWIFGEQPNIWLAQHLKSPFVDITSAIIYTFDMSVPILICAYFYIARKRASFEVGTLSILLMGIMAQITFVLLPTAPPWYVQQFGFKKPWYGRDYSIYSGAGLASFDELTGFPLISKFYSASSDYFAAFPSMHAGFAFVSVLMAYKGLGKKSLLFTVPFTLVVCTIAIYTFHHYIIDLLAGILYATVAFIIVLLLMKLFKRKKILTERGYKYE